MATTQITGVQYSGIWTLQQAHDAISAGDWPTAFTSGYLYTWGDNLDGQLGLGNRTAYSSPKQVGSSSWAKISAKGNASRAIRSDGTLWTWGYNIEGQLGLNNLTKYSSPKQVGALTSWTDVGAGQYHTLAIAGGRLYSWGYNQTYGALGLGNLTNYSSPKQVGSLTTWLKTAAGNYNSYAIKKDGTLWAWGRNNNYGQLGLGNVAFYSSPVQVGSLTNWASIHTHAAIVAAIKTDGTLWTWGNPANAGALGLGTQNTAYSSPVQVGVLTTWSVIAVGSERMFGINTAGNLYSWGSAPQGQLGHGNGNNYSSPKQVGSLTNWLGISAGEYSCLAFKTDGTLWAWGANHVGILGQGNTTNRSSPVQVGSDTSWFGSSVGQDVAMGLRST